MPDCLEDSFAIMIDDCNRKTELNTVREMEKILRDSGVPYAKGLYSGEKDLILLTAQDHSFLTSM